MHSKQLL